MRVVFKYKDFCDYIYTTTIIDPETSIKNLIDIFENSSGYKYDPEKHIISLFEEEPICAFKHYGTKNVILNAPQIEKYYITINYSVIDSCVMILWGCKNQEKYILKMTIYDPKTSGPCTDEDYYFMLKELAEDRYIQKVLIQPEAAHFIDVIKKHDEYDYAYVNKHINYKECFSDIDKDLANKHLFVKSECEQAREALSAIVHSDNLKCTKSWSNSQCILDAICFLYGFLYNYCI